MKKQVKKLALAKETVRVLGERMLGKVQGGTGTSAFNSCECPVSVVDCPPEPSVNQ
jgi:hypothetical protein